MPRQKISRREFSRQMALGSMLIGLHPDFGFHPFTGREKSTKSLIRNIRLQTITPLSELRAFYVESLGLQLVADGRSEITFRAGESTVTFVLSASDGAPWYHFAFNIPQNKLLEARQWQLEKTALIPTPERQRDPDYPDDVRHFKNWNAHSVFFWDPAGNLLEYIARHDLRNDASGPFTPTDILNISEIGFVVDDQQEMARTWQEQLGLDVYPKNAGYWWAMGDEQGLLLAIPKRLWGENTASPKRFAVWETEATILGEQEGEFGYAGLPYWVRVES